MAHTCSELASVYSHRQIIKRQMQGKLSLVKKVISGIYCSILSSLKGYIELSSCFPVSLPRLCFSLFLICRGSLLDLTESCCSDSPAPRHQAYTPISPLLKERAPSLLSVLPILCNKRKNKITDPPSLPSMLEIIPILPVVQQNNS